MSLSQFASPIAHIAPPITHIAPPNKPMDFNSYLWKESMQDWPSDSAWFVVDKDTYCPRRDDPLEPCKVCKRDGAFITHCYCKYQHRLSCVVLDNKNQWKNHLKFYHLKFYHPNWFQTKSTIYNNRNRAAATLMQACDHIELMHPVPCSRK
eukprot:865531_1